MAPVAPDFKVPRGPGGGFLIRVNRRPDVPRDNGRRPIQATQAMTIRLQVEEAGQRMRFAASLVAFALALAPAFALAQAAGAPKAEPRLSNLSIGIWPEYDRAGAALVILKGELAPDVRLPAKVALRLPAASGGPSAVAFSKAPDEGLLNLSHELQTAGDFVTMRFETPERYFHVEFYEPFSTALPARSFTYAWPGDLATERVGIVVQEPAKSSGIEVQPKLEQSTTGGDGLRYLAAQLGPQPAGKALPIRVSYTKGDARPSADIMGLKSSPPAATPVAAAPTAASAEANAPFPVTIIILLAVGLAALGALLVFVWWKRTNPAPAAALPHGACTQCGAPRRAGDRFCGKCGAKLA
jgi:hypothetical protein